MAVFKPVFIQVSGTAFSGYVTVAFLNLEQPRAFFFFHDTEFGKVQASCLIECVTLSVCLIVSQ